MTCRASHSAVGCRVTSNHSNCRRPWLRNRNANNRSKVSDGTTHIAAITSVWFRRNVLQGLRRRRPTPHHVFGDRRLGDFEPQHQQFAMDPGRTPERFLLLIRRMRSRGSRSTFGRPALLRDFQRQIRFSARAMPSQDAEPASRPPGYVEQTGPNPRHPYQQRPDHCCTAAAEAALASMRC